MAGKAKSVYICSECGYESPKWFGCCPGCGEWNTMNEEIKAPVAAAAKSGANARSVKTYALSEITADEEIRYQTGLTELDRVLGGGIVKGSLVLLSGDPGIGKSTILLQICQYIGKNLDILYVSGEESVYQIKLRADRLGVTSPTLTLMSQTDVQSICEYININKPGLVIIDSIQTMVISELNSSAGSVTQVRESTSMFMRTAKSSNIPIIVVGHVNKDGNPSLMLISGRPKNTSGTCIACAMEGTRPILAEVQALVSATSFGNPRRMATGFDYSRMAMLLAVLEKRAGYFFGNTDAYINVIGGLKLDEPATDLSVALALISSLKDVPIRDDVLAFGEIGLGGEIRSVSHCEQRIKEAARLGFKICIIPRHNFKSVPDKLKKEIEVIGVKNVYEAFANCVD